MSVYKPNLEELHRKTTQVRDSAPETYCGVPVPESFASNWDQPEVRFWRMGVRAGLEGAADYADRRADKYEDYDQSRAQAAYWLAEAFRDMVGEENQ